MRMVGALVLKWSQKVNGMTHKRGYILAVVRKNESLELCR